MSDLFSLFYITGIIVCLGCFASVHWARADMLDLMDGDHDCGLVVIPIACLWPLTAIVLVIAIPAYSIASNKV